MASAALHYAVCPQQGKLGLGVVKAVHVRPGPHVVTSLATKRRPIRATLAHPVVELAMVRIVMAGRAGHVWEAEGKDLVFSSRGSDLVALRASHRSVGAV